MSITVSTNPMTHIGFASPAAARLVLLCVTGAAVLVGLLATGAEPASLSVAQAGVELTRLLRGMAVLKALMAAVAAAAVFWRLGSAVTFPWLAAYGLACAAMASGPGLIWDMAHVRLGALLLHGGLLATVVLLWRDPATGAKLSALVNARRAVLAERK